MILHEGGRECYLLVGCTSSCPVSPVYRTASPKSAMAAVPSFFKRMLRDFRSLEIINEMNKLMTISCLIWTPIVTFKTKDIYQVAPTVIVTWISYILNCLSKTEIYMAIKNSQEKYCKIRNWTNLCAMAGFPLLPNISVCRWFRPEAMENAITTALKKTIK